MGMEKHPLPQVSYRKLLDIIRAFTQYGGSVNSYKLSKFTRNELANQRISNTAKFLQSLGVIKRISQGYYELTEIGVNFGDAMNRQDSIEIKKIWRKIIKDIPFLEEIIKAVQYQKSIAKSELKNLIVTLAGVDKTKKVYFDQSAVTIIEILKAADYFTEIPKSHSKNLIMIKEENPSSNFVNLEYIEQLRKLDLVEWDLFRLIRYCEEINMNWDNGNLFSVVFLSRALIDYVPPIFDEPNFDSLYAHASSRDSFKSVCETLAKSLKHIADYNIHQQAKSSQSRLVKEEINFSTVLNHLIGRTLEKLEEIQDSNESPQS